MQTSTIVLFGLLLFVLAIVFGPFLVIWALNTLFATHLEYSWTNWAATAILCGIFGPASITFRQDS